jgi:hypothetical protein
MKRCAETSPFYIIEAGKRERIFVNNNTLIMLRNSITYGA